MWVQQVAGSKYVRLVAPDQAHLLYIDDGEGPARPQYSRSTASAADPPAAVTAPAAVISSAERGAAQPPEALHASRTRKQKNVSAVEVEHPDPKRFPLFSEAGFQEAVLQPGEMLFIPYKWFHYVRTLPPSGAISVNFWF